MSIRYLATEQEVEKAKEKILIENIIDTFNNPADTSPFVRDYYKKLNEKLGKVIIRYWERANNGFRHLPLEEKWKRVRKIKPTIDRLAQVDNPNNLHKRVAEELAEEAFYKIMGIYIPILGREYSLD
jgi:hypothetical protein